MKKISISDVEIPCGAAIYALEEGISASALMTGMICGIENPRLLAIFSDARNCWAARSSLGQDEKLDRALCSGQIIVGTCATAIAQLLWTVHAHLGLDDDIELIDPDDQELLLEAIGAQPGNLSRLVALINRWKSNRIEPAVVREAAARASNSEASDIAGWFARYESEISDLALVDYAGATALLVDAIGQNPIIGAELVKMFPRIVIDLSVVKTADEIAFLKGMVSHGAVMIAFYRTGDRYHEELLDILIPDAPRYRAAAA